MDTVGVSAGRGSAAGRVAGGGPSGRLRTVSGVAECALRPRHKTFCRRDAFLMPSPSGGLSATMLAIPLVLAGHMLGLALCVSLARGALPVTSDQPISEAAGCGALLFALAFLIGGFGKLVAHCRRQIQRFVRRAWRERHSRMRRLSEHRSDSMPIVAVVAGRPSCGGTLIASMTGASNKRPPSFGLRLGSAPRMARGPV